MLQKSVIMISNFDFKNSTLSTKYCELDLFADNIHWILWKNDDGVHPLRKKALYHAKFQIILVSKFFKYHTYLMTKTFWYPIKILVYLHIFLNIWVPLND